MGKNTSGDFLTGKHIQTSRTVTQTSSFLTSSLGSSKRLILGRAAESRDGQPFGVICVSLSCRPPKARGSPPQQADPHDLITLWVLGFHVIVSLDGSGGEVVLAFTLTKRTCYAESPSTTRHTPFSHVTFDPLYTSRSEVFLIKIFALMKKKRNGVDCFSPPDRPRLLSRSC